MKLCLLSWDWSTFFTWDGSWTLEPLTEPYRFHDGDVRKMCCFKVVLGWNAEDNVGKMADTVQFMKRRLCLSFWSFISESMTVVVALFPDALLKLLFDTTAFSSLFCVSADVGAIHFWFCSVLFSQSPTCCWLWLLLYSWLAQLFFPLFKCTNTELLCLHLLSVPLLRLLTLVGFTGLGFILHHIFLSLRFALLLELYTPPVPCGCCCGGEVLGGFQLWLHINSA